MFVRNRVFTYITFKKKLLVFDHVDFPELRMQIPGGTIEEGELPSLAALREAEEETGLSGFKRSKFLGDFERDLSEIGRDEIIHAWFYHLKVIGLHRCDGNMRNHILALRTNRFDLSYIGLI